MIKIILLIFIIIFPYKTSIIAAEIDCDDVNYIQHDRKGNSPVLVLFEAQTRNCPFKVKYPANWFVTETFAFNKSNLREFESIKLVPQPFCTNLSDDLTFVMFEYSNQILKNKKSDWKKHHDSLLANLKKERATGISCEKIQLSGNPAIKYSYLKREKFNFTQYVIQSKTDVITITFAAPIDSLPKYDLVYKAILKSFEIID